MKKLAIVLSSVLASAALCSYAEEAQGPVVAKNPAPPRLTAAKVQEIQMKRFGGVIKDMRAQQGKVVVVNAQSAAEEKWVRTPADIVSATVRIPISMEKGSFDIKKPVVLGNASLFVIDDPALPMSLVAPESRWAMVNVASLKSGKPEFFEMRVRKAVTRGLAYLLGAGASQQPTSIMGCVTKAEDLDQIVTTKIAADVLMRLHAYSAGYGITPYKLTKYKTAVAEGWAAQPTNEFQKAIWDEVHAIPDKPLVIKKNK